MEVTYIIDTQDFNGRYKTEKRTFNNEQHFDNWYDKVNALGIKVIGLEPVESDIVEVEIETQSVRHNSQLGCTYEETHSEYDKQLHNI